MTETEPSSLSEQYHKARRQLVLWSGFLFTWELVGIDLEKLGAGGGNIGALVDSLQSPQAVPWILLILVFYFLFRCIVEWLQCDQARRSLRVSRVDCGLAITVAIAALALYFFQRVLELQVADQIINDPGILAYVTTGVAAGFQLLLIFTWILEWRRTSPKKSFRSYMKDFYARTPTLVFLSTLGTVGFIFSIVSGALQLWLLGAGLGALLMVALYTAVTLSSR